MDPSRNAATSNPCHQKSQRLTVQRRDQRPENTEFSGEAPSRSAGFVRCNSMLARPESPLGIAEYEDGIISADSSRVCEYAEIPGSAGLENEPHDVSAFDEHEKRNIVSLVNTRAVRIDPIEPQLPGDLVLIGIGPEHVHLIPSEVRQVG